MQLSMALVVLSLCFPYKSQAQSDQTTDHDESLIPWQNPIQELQSVAYTCSLKIPEIVAISKKEQSNWQNCVDKITLPVTEKYPVLESRNDEIDADEKVNSSVASEIDRELHMTICRNTSAYKSCWLGIIKTLNKCDPGSGDVAGKIYFALYDDICRAGGVITVENRRKAAIEGNLCQRDYSTYACRINKANQFSKKLCSRFQSNAACDISSIDPNCTNTVDKRLHSDIFERVEKVLRCGNLSLWSSTESSMSGFSSVSSLSFRCTIQMILVLLSLLAFLIMF